MVVLTPTDGTRLLAGISWENSKPDSVDRDIVKLLIAACLVESRGDFYGEYLARVFSDEPNFVNLISKWSREENEHGLALSTWLHRSIPGFDFFKLQGRYNDQIKLAYENSEETRSIRGTKSAELLSRCAVESATSTYYKAVAAIVDDEPLKAICLRLAKDEIGHYSLFRKKLDELRIKESVGSIRLMYMSICRLFEFQDDQMTYAYYVACDTDQPYDSARYSRIMTKIAFRLYTDESISELIKLNLRTFGISKSALIRLLGFENVVSLLTRCLRLYMSTQVLLADLIPRLEALRGRA